MSKTILIVDDEQVLRQSLGELLSEEGYEPIKTQPDTTTAS